MYHMLSLARLAIGEHGAAWPLALRIGISCPSSAYTGSDLLLCKGCMSSTDEASLLLLLFLAGGVFPCCSLSAKSAQPKLLTAGIAVPIKAVHLSSTGTALPSERVCDGKGLQVSS